MIRRLFLRFSISRGLKRQRIVREARRMAALKGAETCRANFRRMDAFKEGME